MLSILPALLPGIAPAALASSAAPRILPAHRSRSTILLAKPLRAREIKQKLEAAGVSTAGIVEKEELLRLLESLPGAGADAAADDAAAVATLPLQLVGGCAYADVRDARGTVRLLVDSGASYSLVAGSAAFRKLNVVAGAAETLALRDSGGVDIDVRVEQVGLPPGVDGILGIDVLRGFAAAELDCAAAELRLHRAPYTAADGVALPMELRRVSAGQLPLITMKFGDVDCGLVLVDTGSPVTMVTPELAEAARMTPDDPDADIITTGVDGQPTRMAATRCARAALDTVVADDVRVFAGVPPMMTRVGWGGERAALLGLDLLLGGGAGRTVVLDFERGELRLR